MAGKVKCVVLLLQVAMVVVYDFGFYDASRIKDDTSVMIVFGGHVDFFYSTLDGGGFHNVVFGDGNIG